MDNKGAKVVKVEAKGIPRADVKLLEEALLLLERAQHLANLFAHARDASPGFAARVKMAVSEIGRARRRIDDAASMVVLARCRLDGVPPKPAE